MSWTSFQAPLVRTLLGIRAAATRCGGHPEGTREDRPPWPSIPTYVPVQKGHGGSGLDPARRTRVWRWFWPGEPPLEAVAASTDAPTNARAVHDLR